MAQRNELIDKAEDVADQVLYFMLLFTPFVSKLTKINCTTCLYTGLSYVMKLTSVTDPCVICYGVDFV